MFPYACVLMIGLGFLAGSLPAHASNFEIAPVVLELSMNRNAGVIRIVNKDDHPVSLQVRGYEWTQLENDDQLNSTEALLISPPMFSIEPGAAQVIRVISRKPLSSKVELAYRLLIDELPGKEQAAVAFKFRISMPVFFQPEKMQAAKINWKVEAGGKQAIVVENQGGQRTKLLNLSLALPDGKRLVPKVAANPYALAGAKRRYEFESSAGLKAGLPVKIYATADTGPVEVETTVSP
ncbi:fimbrial biogenesis chaperone [Undibacterium pigrum]|uniref:Fimbrial chaperone protein n=1 Tax=Undibacterium pigrum TaxID=401470 RepID=A0A318J421_9BURK|nr:fimbria/pilus periplasmic chaperone [Undibacterium pigrum]PXX42095.1 fimbrial chaperone protein [Undibacterium pigrum]